VIAADDDGLERPNQVENLVGCASVADDVAKVPEFVPLPGCGGEDGFKSFEITVDVREDSEYSFQLLALSF
jgi:hypothetical protein